MAFLFNAPECGPGGANPLAQALKGLNQNEQVGRDFLSTRNPVAGPSSFRTATPQQAGSSAQQEADQFFQRQGQGNVFDLRDVRQQLNEASQFSEWDKRFGSPALEQSAQQQRPGGQREAWAGDFISSQGSPSPSLQQQSGPMPSQPYQPRFMNGGMMTRPYGSMMGSSYASYAAQPLVSDKGKGKATSDRFVELTEDQWNDEFAKVTSSSSQDNLGSVASPMDEETEDDDRLQAEIDATWRNMQRQMDDNAAMDKEMAQWEAQYGSQFVDQDGDFPAYEGPLDTFDLEKLQNEPPEYAFEPENAFQDTADPFEEGKRLLAAGAPLSHVAQAFEEACKRDATRAEAWLALGDTLAADEKELQSIAALERAVALPGRGGESAWLSLAIAYINEGRDSRALSVLEQWIQRCYPDSYAPLKGKDLDPMNPWAGQQRITDMFLNAARAGPSTRKLDSDGQMGQIDPDVQVGLGVLFYGNSDYSFAKDCFEAALSERPKDWILWNRLGATLANGGHPEEAISAYRTALDLRPNFPRSLYNLAVSCLNINCFKEAAEHLLAAIELQGGSSDGSSDNLWSTLRRAFFCMERPDLAEKAVAGGNISALKAALG